MDLPLSEDLDYSLLVLLRQAEHTVFKSRNKELRKYGISTEEAAVLFIVKCIGYRAIPAEISRWMLRERHTMTALLNRMKKKGLIRMTKDLDRKNLIRVSLTKKGRRLYDSSTAAESHSIIMSTLSEQDLKQLLSYLRSVRDRALEDLRINNKPPFP